MSANTTVGLVDGGQLIRMVTIGDKAVEIYGVSLDGVVLLLDRFPEFRSLITPKRGEEKSEFTMEGIIKMGPRIIGAVIAAGLGKPGDAKLETEAKAYPVGLQIKLIRQIVDLTFPGGLGPFVEDLRAMGLLKEKPPESSESGQQVNGSSGSDGTGKVPGTSSSSPPSGSAEQATPVS